MKALQINTETREVVSVEIQDYKEIYALLGQECETFACPITFDNGDTIYTDDEGLYHQFSGGFIMKDWNYPLVGNALVLGTDLETGDSQDVIITKDKLCSIITWVNKNDCVEHSQKALNTPPSIFFI